MAASYLRYVEALLAEFLPRYGGQMLYVGDGSREAFSRMVADHQYQLVTPLRTEALSEAVLQATVPWT